MQSNKVFKLIEFIKTGSLKSLCGLSFGIDRDTTTEIFGEPDDVHFSGKKYHYPSILKYGNIEFYFGEGERGKLNGVQIKPVNKNINNLGNYKIDYGPIVSGTSFQDIYQYLEKENIEFQLTNFSYDNSDIRRMQIIGGAQLVFTIDFNEKMSIDKVLKFTANPFAQHVPKRGRS